MRRKTQKIEIGISDGDKSSIQETLYLLSIPDMRGKIKNGLNTPVSKCSLLDVKGINANISRTDIVKFVRKSRKGL